MHDFTPPSSGAMPTAAWRDLGYEGPLSQEEVVAALDRLGGHSPDGAAIEITMRALRAEVERLKRERDEAILDKEDLILVAHGIKHYADCGRVAVDALIDRCERCRAEDAEAERDRLRGALQRIAENWRDDDHASLAAAALKREEKS